MFYLMSVLADADRTIKMGLIWLVILHNVIFSCLRDLKKKKSPEEHDLTDNLCSQHMYDFTCSAIN